MGDVITALVARRKKLGVSQRSVGKVLGVSHALVSHWERRLRTPSADRLNDWADALGCELVLHVVASVDLPVQIEHQNTQAGHYEWMRTHPRDGRFLLPTRR